MFKKIASLVLALIMCATACVVLTACGEGDEEAAASSQLTPVGMTNIKVGFIFLHDANSTYDKNFINGAQDAIAALGLTNAQYVMKYNIPEGNEC